MTSFAYSFRFRFNFTIFNDQLTLAMFTSLSFLQSLIYREHYRHFTSVNNYLCRQIRKPNIVVVLFFNSVVAAETLKSLDIPA